MITLILSESAQNEIGVILGYIISALEIVIVLLTTLSFFIPADSKVGKVLSKVLKGLYIAKSVASSVAEKEKDETEKDKDDSDQKEDKQ